MHATAESVPVKTPWGTVFSIGLAMFVLIASEFMPVPLLTPIARDLSMSEGQVGQAVSFSGLFAVLTSLFGGSLLARLDRRVVLLAFTVIVVGSSISMAMAEDPLSFLLARALIGMSIGGYISLTTSVIARTVRPDDLTRALAVLQSGTALAAVVAQPAGSLIGSVAGWRGAFVALVLPGLVALVWQALVLPKLPPEGRGASVRENIRLLGNRTYLTGMGAMMLFFVAQFALSTYLRPYLETITGLDVSTLSLFLLAIGLSGLAGTTLVPGFLEAHLRAMLIGLPAVLGVVAILLVVFGTSAWVALLLLIIWGLLTTPMPTAWTMWMTTVIPDKLEAGGAMLVALIQLAITGGAFGGGVLFDGLGWWTAFVFAGLAFFGAGLVALRTSPH